MSYRQFTIQKVVKDFDLTLIEQGNIFESDWPTATLRERVISPSPYLAEFITQNYQLAIALNTEKARSELLICPVLLAVREFHQYQISLFSGEEFNVDPEVGLNGTCDFIISLSPEQLFIKAPVAIIIEAKKEDLKGGLGQCIAAMVAAGRFNQQENNSNGNAFAERGLRPIATVYGAVTTGTLWRFLKLEEKTVTLDLAEYLLPPIEPILGKLVQMVE
ncbi:MULTISPECIES: hypothetical protein [Moorena]|uniref:Uncharacterized protein n=1 Tax=Moorena producens 3L TaxID=489825 RepID=F4XYN0_9CYAN|nr:MULTISPECIES: hypothetical protein [Moorena]NEQ13557.1 hypothetical protein [Moorena sp. SIO3E2]EGJ30317.1 hypothetical protein LYNGBM3L_52010 [Moorena producens 3L]NEP35588.1 hypothetical protein [Moorena sp. SIO3B2]NEP64198.1 hypothetical protein [Moorena sp. SIO3A5]NEQ08234.1 hypothetical protein [Moorena sp. SIO4E2]